MTFTTTRTESKMTRSVTCALLCLLGTPSTAAATSSARPVAQATADLADIQQRIQQARLAAFTTGDPAALVAITARLRAIKPSRTGQMAYYVPYWLAYADYLLANTQMKAGRKADAAVTLREAYAALSEVPSPDVESQTLLSLVAGARIGAVSPEQMGEAIGQARDALEQAVNAGPGNVRVLYARALADHTTPKEYGGGRAAEKYLRSALDLPVEAPRALRPGWGRDDCAALLVRVLRAGGRAAEAATLHARFLTQYPNSAPIRALAK